jgi:hypothetical protein
MDASGAQATGPAAKAGEPRRSRLALGDYFISRTDFHPKHQFIFWGSFGRGVA